MDLDCPLCRQKFSEKRIPMVLCNKQHLSCQHCVNSMFQYKSSRTKSCPQCRQDLNREKIIKFRLFFVCQQKIKAYTSKLSIEAEAEKVKLFRDKQGQLQMRKNLLQQQKIKYLKEKQLVLKERQEEKKKYYQTLRDYKKIIVDSISLRRANDTQYYRAVNFEAQKLISLQKYEIASLLLENIIQKFPFSSKLIGIGSKQEEKGLSQNCDLNWYKQYYKLDSFDSEDILAFCYLRNSRCKTQNAFYQRVLSTNPTNHKILYGLSLTQHNAGNFDRALSLYKQIIQIKPSFSKPYQQIARIYFQRNNLQNALQYSRLCINLQPKNIFAQLILITQIKNYQQISQKINTILQISPKYCRAINQLGKHQFDSRQYEKAMQQYNKCIQLNKYYIQPVIGLGKCYYQLGNYQKSLQILLKIDKDNKSFNQAYDYYCTLGKVYRMMKKYKDSVQSFDKSIKIIPQNKAAHHQLGQTYLQFGKFSEAANIYKDLIMVQEKSDYYAKIIESQCSKLDFVNPILWLNKWLLMEPNNVQIHGLLADNYFKIDDLENSLKFCQICLEKKYNLNKYYAKSIQILEKQKKYEEQIRQIRSFIKQCQLSWEEIQKLTKLGTKIELEMKRLKQNQEH